MFTQYSYKDLFEGDYRPAENEIDGMKVKQSHIEGDMDFSDLDIHGKLVFQDSRAGGKLDLSNSTAEKIDIMGCDVTSVDIKGSDIESIYIREPAGYEFETDRYTRIQDIRSIRELQPKKTDIPMYDMYEMDMKAVQEREGLLELLRLSEPSTEFRDRSY